MARAKKELKDQLPVDGQPLGTAAPPEGTSQETTPGSGQEVGTAGGLSDLELASASSLNPDAVETEGPPPGTESGGQAPQTDSESPLKLGDASADGSLLQAASDPEAEAAGILQTGPETGQPLVSSTESFGGDGAFGNAGFPGAVVPPFYMSSQEAAPDATQGPVEPNSPPTGDPGALQTEFEEGPDPAAPEDPPIQSADSSQVQAAPGQSRPKLRMPRQRGSRVVSIDAERTVETEHDRLRSDLLDLVESMKGRKILSGTIQGVERLASNPEMCYGVTYHGDFKVIIPVLDAIEEPEDYRGQPKGDVLHYLLNKRLGAEVDYIVKRIDQEGGVVAASRLEAMALKRREYYLHTDRDGNYQIYAGIRAEARVVSVIRAGIFVDLFGAECYIPLRELSYQRWMDAASHYQPGQRVLVKVLEVDRSNHDKPRVTVSVKQASENPYEKALKKFAVGSRYVGTVSMVDVSGVFVSLDGGIDCLCTHPKRGRPPRGARATVRILGINHENNRIWGVITHMSTAR